LENLRRHSICGCCGQNFGFLGETLQTLGGGDDKYLTAGLQGYELANAAELLRGYPPFAKNGLAIVTDMLLRVILPMNEKFLNHGEGSEHNVKHFFANWELCNVASAMAIVCWQKIRLLGLWHTLLQKCSGNAALTMR